MKKGQLKATQGQVFGLLEDTRDLVEECRMPTQKSSRHKNPSKAGSYGRRDRVISPNRSSRLLMRSVSGLGMEDPVLGEREAVRDFPEAFTDEESLGDIANDIRDAISVASDPTADVNSGVDITLFHRSLGDLNCPVSRFSRTELSIGEPPVAPVAPVIGESSHLDHPTASSGMADSATVRKRPSLDGPPKCVVRKSSASFLGSMTTQRCESHEHRCPTIPVESGPKPKPEKVGESWENTLRDLPIDRTNNPSLADEDPLNRPRTLSGSLDSVLSFQASGLRNSVYSEEDDSRIKIGCDESPSGLSMTRNGGTLHNLMAFAESMPEFEQEALVNLIPVRDLEGALTTQRSTMSTLKRKNPRRASALSDLKGLTVDSDVREPHVQTVSLVSQKEYREGSHRMHPGKQSASLRREGNRRLMTSALSTGRDKPLTPPAREKSRDNFDLGHPPPYRVLRKGRRSNRDVCVKPPVRSRSYDDSNDLVNSGRRKLRNDQSGSARGMYDTPPALPPMTCMMDGPNCNTTTPAMRSRVRGFSSSQGNGSGSNSHMLQRCGQGELPSNTCRSIESHTSHLGQQTSHTVRTKSSESTIHLPGGMNTTGHSATSFGDSTWFTDGGSTRLDSLNSKDYSVLFDWEGDSSHHRVASGGGPFPSTGARQRIASTGE
eukprot:CAMPEP_0172447000 /NCGR_PEP_ID=MMETSP1065-20121228/6406_1 /TAXON_ID=265537 /ORGANISM="Amphiprora paludosa, Strain CCMP125" /LENGTH=661 /DNA_ID=CAMNT_0013198193 /DNA_START=292 /DNA_END=2277 /DNA_ORIENTATION=-